MAIKTFINCCHVPFCRLKLFNHINWNLRWKNATGNIVDSIHCGLEQFFSLGLLLFNLIKSIFNGSLKEKSHQKLKNFQLGHENHSAHWRMNERLKNCEEVFKSFNKGVQRWAYEILRKIESFAQLLFNYVQALLVWKNRWKE